MKINCVSCGHKVDIGEAYDNYEGWVRCYVCSSLLDLKTEEGSVKTIRPIDHNGASFLKGQTGQGSKA